MWETVFTLWTEKKNFIVTMYYTRLYFVCSLRLSPYSAKTHFARKAKIQHFVNRFDVKMFIFTLIGKIWFGKMWCLAGFLRKTNQRSNLYLEFVQSIPRISFAMLRVFFLLIFHEQINNTSFLFNVFATTNFSLIYFLYLFLLLIIFD